MPRLAMIALLLAALPAASADLNPPQLEPKYGEGCWVRFFEQPDFEQPLGRLAGAMYVNSVRGPGPGLIGKMSEEEFFRRSRSLVVGPEAKLTAYAERGFRAELFSLEPGRQVKDLRTLGFPKNVSSLKILCEYQR
jgi:hypothetical protein